MFFLNLESRIPRPPFLDPIFPFLFVIFRLLRVKTSTRGMTKLTCYSETPFPVLRFVYSWKSLAAFSHLSRIWHTQPRHPRGSAIARNRSNCRSSAAPTSTSTTGTCLRCTCSAPWSRMSRRCRIPQLETILVKILQRQIRRIDYPRLVIDCLSVVVAVVLFSYLTTPCCCFWWKLLLLLGNMVGRLQGHTRKVGNSLSSYCCNWNIVRCCCNCCCFVVVAVAPKFVESFHCNSRSSSRTEELKQNFPMRKCQPPLSYLFCETKLLDDAVPIKVRCEANWYKVILLRLDVWEALALLEDTKRRSDRQTNGKAGGQRDR